MEEKEYLQTLGEQILNPHARTHVLEEIPDNVRTTGCTFIPGLALKSWGNMQDMNKLLQSKPDGFASSLNEGAFGRTEKLSA